MEKGNKSSWHFINRAKYYLGLILIIIIILIWGYSKIYFLKKSYKEERHGLITNYETKIDNINVTNMQLTAKAFSWAIRSELIRENNDQISQFFDEFIKTPGILKLQLINTENSTIEISTDKKDVGLPNTDYIDIKKQETISGFSEMRIITPISGMNNQIGIFILDANKIKD